MAQTEQNNQNCNKDEDINYDKHLSEILNRIDYWHYERKANVIPANYITKAPVVNWTVYQNSRIADEQLEKWKKEELFHKGFAVILGKTYDKNETHYLICIDCDKKHAIDEILSIDKKITSITSLTEKYLGEQHEDNPNSLHFYFFSPIPFPSKSSDPILGLEVRSNEKSLIIPAPNFHQDGHQWKILGVSDPPVLTIEQAKELSIQLDIICNKYGLNYLNQKKTKKIDNRMKKMIYNLIIDKDSNYVIVEGERHLNLLSIANLLLLTHLKSGDSNVEKLRAFFDQINQKICSPEPLPQEEIDSIWNSSLDFVKGKKDFSVNEGFNTHDDLHNRTFSSIVERATEIILNTNHFVTIEESKQILYYQSGVYIPGGSIIIEKEAENIFGYELSNNHLTEIKGHIMRRTYHKRLELDMDLDIINLQNGLYSINKNQLMPHTSDYLSINQKPVVYDSNAEPKLFGKFLKDVLYPQEIRTAIEAMAYTFYRDYPYEYYFKLFGYGSNGKSVFTALLTSLHGKINVSNVSVKSLIENRFALADLEFKDMNIDSEYSDISIKDTSILKKLTGGRKQPTRIERKNQHAYDTYLYAKLFFNANSLNERIEKTNADYRREIIISFPNTFEGKKDDPQLQQKLEKQEEISAIFNILMIALRHILKNKGIYMNEKTIEERRRKSERVADPIKSFVEDAVAEDSTEADWIAKTDFHTAYTKFCKRHKIAIKPIEIFAKDLGKIKRFDQQKKTINGERKMVWLGIRLNPQYLLSEEQQILSDLC